MKTGIQIIEEERQRQISVEGYTLQHDDEHGAGELAFAASCYSRYAGHQSEIEGSEFGSVSKCLDGEWPWEVYWWKPSNNKIKNLAKAGALIAAEIDRIQRLNSEYHSKSDDTISGEELVIQQNLQYGLDENGMSIGTEYDE